jgi:cytoskeletal protein CcmA (bactofilin family)
MKILNEKYNADFTIEVETNLVGIINGNVTARNSVIFIINGIINGNLTIERNSRAILYGMINGNITNFGKCEIYGVVDGNLFGETDQIFIDKNGIVNRNGNYR